MSRDSVTARRTIWIAFSIVLVDMLGVGILIPIIPLLFTDPSYAYHLHITARHGYILLGALVALYPFTMFLAMPILGQLSDTFGRKPILVISLCGTAISYVIFGLGIVLQNIPLLFIARALDGVTGGNIAVAQAAIADTTTDEERPRKFGIIGAANGLGFIVGPLVGALFSDPSIISSFGAPTPFWIAAGLSVLNMLAAIFLLPETLRTKTKKHIKILQSFYNIKYAATGKEQRPLFITTFMYQAGFSFIITFFGVYLVSRFSFGQHEIGFLFAFVGLLLALSQLTIIGPLAKRMQPRTIILICLAVMSLALVGVYFVYDPLFLYALTIPIAISAGLALTNLTVLISTSSKDKEQGSALGINSSVQALAQSIPAVFAGGIAAIFAPTTPVLFAAITIAAAGAFFFFSTSKDSFLF